MKKYLVILVLAFCASVQSNAQTTWNVRAGGGMFSRIVEVYYEWENSDGFGPMLSLETNIPFATGSKLCISPSLLFATYTASSSEILLPIHFGYKLPVGNSGLFIPKVGPFVGYTFKSLQDVLFGPSVELAYEYNHFIVALNASLGVIGEVTPHVFLSVGYKF
ncbi:MAG: hypothetical protein ACI3YD_07275 [Alloprevotella sp.]